MDDIDVEQLISKYDDIINTIHDDEEILLKVLLEQFGSVYALWNIIHTNYTGLEEHRDLDDYQIEEEVSYVVDAYRKVMDDLVEQELLDD